MPAFIKLHPHSLVFNQSPSGDCTADLSFSIEQYGLMVRDCMVKLKLFAPNELHSHWWMVCEDPAQLKVPGFAVFLRSLEKYVFSTMQFSPLDALLNSPESVNLRLVSGGTASSELFFDKMYFDITQVAFHLQKD
jgi:hypothetical protein